MISGFALSAPLVLSIAIIWLAISASTRLGYGLKYLCRLRFTHLADRKAPI